MWHLSHALVLEIYKITQHFPPGEFYGITNQMGRAAVSVPTNISEGCGRETDAEFARFLHIATGSANETEYLVQLSFDLKYLSEQFYKDLIVKINLVKKKIYHLNKTLKTKS